MARWRLVAACLLLAGRLAAIDQIIWASDHPCLRPGLLFQGRLRCPDLPANGTYRLEAAILAGESSIHASRATRLSAAELARGFRFSWVPPRTLSRVDCRLEAVVTDGAGRPVASLHQPLLRWAALLVELDAVVADHEARAVSAPLPDLWIEQAALQARGAPSLRGCRLVRDRIDRLRAWREQEDPQPLAVGSHELAYRCEIDGSVQPWRLHLPEHDPSLLALVLGAPAGVDKASWPALPPAWLKAADRAGVVLVEVYPAGDRYWSGIAGQRCWQVLRRAHLRLGDSCGDLPRVVVTRGPALAGGLGLLGENPDAFAAGVYLSPELGSGPEPLPPPPLPEAARYLRRLHDPLRGLRQLRQLPHLAQAAADDAASELLNDLRTAAVEVGGLAVDPSVHRFWNVVATTADRPPPEVRGYDVWGPGRYGNFLVVAVEDWLEPASLLYEATGRELSGAGIADLRLHDWQGAPPTWNGQPLDPRRGPPPPGVKALGRARGPAARFHRRPFVVVRGTRHHLKAVEVNRRLAADVLADWAAHAQGRPPVYTDREIDRIDRRANLVLCGNTLSHDLLRRWDLDLPVVWKRDTVTVVERELPARQVRGLVLAWPHPAGDGRLLVILDGEAVWRRPTAIDTPPPLHGVGDLFVRLTDGTVIHRVFDADWR